jgi:hypothetical protein
MEADRAADFRGATVKLKIFAAAIAAACSVAGAGAASYTWNGSASTLWSNAANWTPNGVPQSGDSLEFVYLGGAVPGVTVNDLAPGQTFTLQSSVPWEIQGNELVSPTIATGSSFIMSAPLRFTSAGTWRFSEVRGPVDMGPHAVTLHVTKILGPLSGSGAFTWGNANGCCGYEIAGSHPFAGTVSGAVSAFARDVTLAAPVSLAGLSGRGTFGPVTVSSYFDGGRLVVGSLKLAPGARMRGDDLPVQVNGSVDIDGAILTRGSVGTLQRGQVVEIIDNDGTDPVIGTFRDLPEGAIFEANDESFVVSYVGGDGNDVTLTAQRVTSVWREGGPDSLWSNPANWRNGVAPTNGDSILFPSQGESVNDIPGLVLHSVYGNAEVYFPEWSPNYTISGEPLGVTGTVDVVNVRLRLRAMADGVEIRGDNVLGGIDVNGHAITVRASIVAETPAQGVAGTGTINYTPGGSRGISGIHAFNGTVVASRPYPSSIYPFEFHGEMPASFTLQGQSITGSGLMGSLRAEGATVMPRPFFDVGNLSLDAASQLDLESLVEPVDVGGTVSLASPALVLRSRNHQVGRTYVAIRNDASDPIQGTFANLPEGAVAKTAGGHFDFRASYVGGDGNDFTLTALNGKAVPGDFTRDGKADILWHHVGGNGNDALGLVHRMSMDGLAIASQETIYAEPDGGWKIVGHGDFDANGVTDLLWRHATDGYVYVMLMGADGRPMRGQVVYRETDPTWKIIGAPDVDGDGRADILWWRTGGGFPAMYALYMDGTTIRSQNHRGSGPMGALEPMIGDFNGDGRDDVLWRTSNGSVEIPSPVGGWRPIYREPDFDWRIVGTPDLNGDGHSDILWQRSSTGDVFGMLVVNGEIVDHGYIHRPEMSSWRIANTGDYDGDGKQDLLWHNEADGRVHVMLMSGFAIKDQRTIYREPDTGWKPIGPRTFSAP